MDTIGKYKIEALIGEGGFGRVYRAFDPTVNRTVAIKIVRIESHIDEQQVLLNRFRSEAKTTGTLLHKNIVTVYDFGEQDGVPYLVMEYLQGRTLDEFIDKNEPMSLAEKVSLMKQVGEGLQYAHGKGIIHRDVKPANIMVLNDGGVKLMDFGIARLLRDQGTRMTQHGKLMGTFAYMSPEQFEGKDVDSLTDIFAYGVIYYHLITGQHPFRGPKGTADLAVLIRNVTTAEPLAVSARAPECPPTLEKIILKAIHKDRRQRYQSIDDIQYDVAPILNQLEADLAEQKTKEGENLLAEGRIEQARNVVREALRLAPANQHANDLRRKIQQQLESRAIRERCEPLLRDGREKFDQGRFGDAIEAFQDVLQLDPLDSEAGKALNDAQNAQQRVEHADALFDQANRQISADNLTGAASLADQFFEEALALINELKIIYPPEKVHQLAVATQEAQERRNKKQNQERQLKTAEEHLNHRAWSSAMDILRLLTIEDPGNPKLQALLRAAQDGLNDQQKTEYVAGVVSRVHTLISEEKFDQAAGILAEALQKFPNEPALSKLQSKNSSALRQFEQKLAIDQCRKRAMALRNEQRLSEAISELDKTIRTWDANELVQLRDQIAAERQTQDASKKIADARSEVQRLIAIARLDEASLLAHQYALEYPNDSGFADLIASIEAAKSNKRKQGLDAEIEAMAGRAKLLLQKTDFDKELETIQAGFRRFQDDPRLKTLSAQIDAARDDQLRKLELQKVLESAARLQSTGLPKEAAKILEAFLRKYPNMPQAELQLEQIRQKISAAEEIERLLGEARRLRDRGDIPECSKLVEDGIKQFPESAELLAFRNEIAERTRQAEIESLTQKVERLRAEGDTESAVRQLEQLLSKYPSDSVLLALKSKLEADLAERTRLEEIDHAEFDARKLIDGKELASAIAVLDRVLRRFPGEQKLIKLRELAREFEASNKNAVDGIVHQVRQHFDSGKDDLALSALNDGLTMFRGDKTLLDLQNELQATLLARTQLVNPARPDPKRHQAPSRPGPPRPEPPKAKHIPVIIAAAAGLLLTAGLIFLWYHHKNVDERAGGGNRPAQTNPPGAKGLDVHFSTDPVGATVRVNGQRCTASDCMFHLAEGTHSVVASLDGYESAEKSLSVPGANSQERLTLTPLPNVLNITTNLTRGDVRLDNVPVGSISPQGDFSLKSVKPGDHELTIGTGTGSTVRLKFTAAPGHIPVAQTPVAPPDSQVVAAATLGRKAQLVTDGKAKTVMISQRPVSSMNAPLDLDGYGPQELSLLDHKFPFNVGNTENRASPTLTVFLVNTVEKDRMPIIQISTGVPGLDVSVSVDGAIQKMKTGPDGSLSMESKPGKHTVGVEGSSGYVGPPPQPVVLALNDKKSLDFAMKPSPAVLQISGTPSETHVWIDGVEKGVFPQNQKFDVEPGEHRVEFRKSGYKTADSRLDFARGETKPYSFSLTPDTPTIVGNNNNSTGNIVTPVPGTAGLGNRGNSTVNIPTPPPPDDPDQKDWEKLDKTNAIAVRAFIASHSKSRFLPDANKILEDLDWNAVTRGNSRQGFVDFINTHKNGAHETEARQRIEGLDVADIRAALSEYAAEFGKKNLNDLKKKYSIDSKLESTLSLIFKQPDLSISNPHFDWTQTPRPSNDAVEVNGKITYTPINRGIRPDPQSIDQIVNLQRENGKWVVKKVQRN